MSKEENNKAVVRRVTEEVFNRGNMSVLPELIHPEYVYHGPQAEYHGPDGLKEIIVAYRKSFPDIRATIEDLVAEGDKVAARIIVTGTFKGEPFMGMAPTGRSCKLIENVIFHFKDGKEVAAFPISDALTFFRQLGIPIPEE